MTRRGLLPDLQADRSPETADSADVRRPTVFDPVSGFNMTFVEGPQAQLLPCPGAPDGQHRDPTKVAAAASKADAEFLGELLSRFFHYYAWELCWWKDAISIHRVGVTDAKSASSAFFSSTPERMEPEMSTGGARAGGQTIDKSEAWEAMQHAPWVPRHDNGIQLPKLWRLSVIDPFEYTHDLGVVLSEGGMAALKSELSRAAAIICGAACAEPQPQQQLEPQPESSSETSPVSEPEPESEQSKTEASQNKPQQQQDLCAKVRYNTRMARWEVEGLEGVKKIKEVSVQLLCEEETSGLVGRKLGLAEERLKALQKTYFASKGDIRDSITRTTTSLFHTHPDIQMSTAAEEKELGMLASLDDEVVHLKTRLKCVCMAEKQQQSQKQRATVDAQQHRNVPHQPAIGRATGGGRGGRGFGRGQADGQRREALGTAGGESWPRLDPSVAGQQASRGGAHRGARGRSRGRGRGRDRGRGGGRHGPSRGEVVKISIA